MLKPEIRQSLLRAGYRVIGAEFNGSGDDGCIEAYVFPTDDKRHLSLAEVQCYLEYNKPKAKEVEALVAACTPEWSETLDALFDQVLENFPGDWINNDGGHGTVAVDLQTGAWTIDGWERFTDETEVNAEGTMEFLQATPTDDQTVVDLVKQTLIP